MTEDVSAGRLLVDVVADATGLREDLRAKLDAASRDLKATVTLNLKVQADQAKTQIDRVAKDRLVKLSVKADTAPAREDIDLVSADRTVTIKAKADTAPAREDIDLVSADRTVTIKAKAATSDADADLDAAAARKRTATIKAKADTSTLGADIEKIGKTVASVSQFTAIGAGLVEAAGAAGNLAGALVAVVAAAGQAVGLIGVLPGLLAAAGQGAGVVVLGMSGISKAVGALTTVQMNAGASATQSALAQMQAADQVRSAQQGLANAQIQAAESVASAQHNVRQAVLAVGDAQYNAAQSVSSSLHTVRQDVTAVSDAQYNAIQSVTQAEHSLTDAEYSEQQAQLALTQAREDARQNLLQTSFDLRGAVIGEAQAALSLTEAKTKLEQTLQSASATDQQKQQAQLDLQQAQLAYDESVNKTQQATVAKAKADKAGVDGSQQVVAARHGESDAAFALQQSEQALARARVEAARSVADAQYQLAQAQQAAARAQVMAIRSVADAEYAQGQAVQALSDAQRTAAQSVASAQRSYTEALLAASLPTAGMTSQAIALQQALKGLSPAGVAFAEFIAAKLIPRYHDLQKAVQEAFLPGVQAGVQAALPLLSTLQAGLVATGTVMGDLAAKFGAFLGSPGSQSDLAMIMRVNAAAIGVFGDAGLHMADALRNITVAAEPLIPKIADLADRVAILVDNATIRGRADGGLAGFFDRAWQSALTLGRIVVDLGATLGHVLGAAAPAGGTLLSSLADATDRLRAWTADPVNAQRMQAFFANTIPLAKQVGDALVRIAGILIRLSADMGGGQYNVIFSALNIILSILTDITKIPGFGTVVNYILALSLAGIGLGRVATNITSIGKGLAAIAKFTGLKDLLATVTGGGKAAASTAVETAATAMQTAADTMVSAAAAMQRAADTMVGADAAGAGGAGAGGAAAKGATAAETSAEGSAIGAGIGGKLLGAGIIAAIALAIVQIGVKPLLAGKSSGTQQDSNKPGNWWDNPGGANPTDPRTAGQGWSTWAGAGTQIKDWFGFGQSTPNAPVTPATGRPAPAGITGAAFQAPDPNVGEMAWVKWWQDFDRDFIHKITDWFTVSLPHLVTAGLPIAGHDFVAHFDEIRHDFARWTDDCLHITANGFDKIRHAAATDVDALAQQVSVLFDGMRHEVAHTWDNLYYNTVSTVIRLGKDTLAHLESGLVKPAENALKTAWNWVYANVATPVVTFFTRTLPHAWDTTIGFLKSKLVTPLENGLKTAWNWVYANVATPIVTFFTRTLPGIWDTAINGLATRFITPFENSLRGAWNWVLANVLTPLGNYVTRTLPGYFTSAVGQIKQIWSGIEGAFSGPVKFVVNSVINPLIGDVDAVLSFVHLPQIKKVPGFAGGTGGAPPGWAWTGEQGPELVYMQGGEIVLPSPVSRQLAGDGMFPGYAGGTPVGGNPGGPGGIFGPVVGAGKAVLGGINGILAWAKNLSLGALAATFEPVADALLNLMPKPQSGAQSMIEALPRSLVTDLVAYVKSKDPGAGVGGGSGADVANYAKTFATGLSHPYVLGGASPNGWDCSGFTAWVYEHFGYFPEKQGSRHGTSESQFADPLLQSSGADTGALAFFDDGIFANPGHVAVVLNPNAHVSASGTAVGTIIGTNAGAVGYRIPKGGFRAAGTGGGSLGPGSANFAADITTVLRSMGLPLSLVGNWLSQIQTESGGNAQAVNRTDSNAQAGHPSVGILQLIPSTFATYAGPYLNTPPLVNMGGGLVSENIMAQIYAGIHYAAARYGGAAMASVIGHGHGYDTGGPLPPGVTTVVNSTGRDEWVLNPQAVDLLGGARAVAQLNMAGQAHAAATTGMPLPAAATKGGIGRPGSATVNVFPAPHQSEEEIGAVAARKLGMMLV